MRELVMTILKFAADPFWNESVRGARSARRAKRLLGIRAATGRRVLVKSGMGYLPGTRQRISSCRFYTNPWTVVGRFLFPNKFSSLPILI